MPTHLKLMYDREHLHTTEEAATSPLTSPRCRHPRSLSIHPPPTPTDIADADEVVTDGLTTRSTSLSSFYDFSHAQLTKRVRISYSDDALCAQALENIYRVLRAAKQAEEHTADTDSSGTAASDKTPTSNSALLAQKALRYRRLLDRVQQTNLEDPAFDINAFLRVSWCKMEQHKQPSS